MRYCTLIWCVLNNASMFTTLLYVLLNVTLLLKIFYNWASKFSKTNAPRIYDARRIRVRYATQQISFQQCDRIKVSDGCEKISLMLTH